jgi:uncharacterized protein (TIGR02246 family)
MDDPLARSVRDWVEEYVRAWNSNDPAEIGALFTEDASYYTEPFSPPWRGREEIVRQWLARKDEPGDTEFDWHPVVVTADLAVVQGEAAYRSLAKRFSNLWVIRLDASGRCTEFTEWWMQLPETSSSA